MIEIKKDKKEEYNKFILDKTFPYYEHNVIHDYPTLSNKYSKERVSNVLSYIFCNSLNSMCSLQKYYIITEDIKNTYDNEIEYYLENFEKIITNNESNGWHFPTKEEIEYVQQKQKAEETKNNMKNNIGNLFGVGGASNKSPLLNLDASSVQEGNFIIRTNK